MSSSAAARCASSISSRGTSGIRSFASIVIGDLPSSP
jgi:hypothetical protein